MFAFIRRYQRFLFIFVTTIVVFSFSFFGTYSTFMGPKEDNSVVFIASDGSKVRRVEFRDYVQFLSSESQDLYGFGQGRFNPANSGVITNQILGNGIGQLIWKKMQNKGEPLLDVLSKEREFSPYSHPQYPFVGLESVWAYFAPTLSAAYKNYNQKLSLGLNQDSDELFAAKVTLYCAQKQFPPALSRQVMLYQLSQLGDTRGSNTIDGSRLALFGYDSIQDWFGAPFVEACAMWIYNSARIAESQGLVVSDREALFSMLKQCQELLIREQGLKQMGFQSPTQLLVDRLRQIGVDEPGAVRVVRDILLSQKLLERASTAVPVASEVFKPLVEAANNSATINAYMLPEELQVKTQDQMYQIQLWIDAVSKKSSSSGWEALLELPKETLSPEVLVKTHPQLVQKQFQIQWAAIDAEDIAAALPLREVWAWQGSESGWKGLQNKFPELKDAANNDASGRLQAIEALIAGKKEEVDAYSRKILLQEKPDRIHEALAQAEMKHALISVRMKGSVLPFKGITDPKALDAILSSAAIGEQVKQLEMYTQDNQHYTKILVLDRQQQSEVLPLAKALSDGTLQAMLEETVQAAYTRIRSQNPKNYLQENGEWKPIAAVRDELLEKNFHTLLSALDQAREIYKPIFRELCNWEQVKSARLAVRFMPFIKMIWDRIQKDSALISEYVDDNVSFSGFDNRPGSQTLKWKLRSKNLQILRKEGSSLFTYKNIQNVKVGSWVLPQFSLEMGIVFATVIEKGMEPIETDLADKMSGSYRLLGSEVSLEYAKKLISKMEFATSP